jgi:hypothetical protein
MTSKYFLLLCRCMMTWSLLTLVLCTAVSGQHRKALQLLRNLADAASTLRLALQHAVIFACKHGMLPTATSAVSTANMPPSQIPLVRLIPVTNETPVETAGPSAAAYATVLYSLKAWIPLACAFVQTCVQADLCRVHCSGALLIYCFFLQAPGSTHRRGPAPDLCRLRL